MWCIVKYEVERPFFRSDETGYEFAVESVWKRKSSNATDAIAIARWATRAYSASRQPHRLVLSHEMYLAEMEPSMI